MRTGILAQSPEWYAARQTRVTASKVAAILGESRYSSPLAEWARIMGRLAASDRRNGYADWGLATEDAHRRWYAEDTGCDVEPGTHLWQHDSIPWLACTPDGFAEDRLRGGRHLLELKAPSPWTADEWQEALPQAYIIQVQIGLLVCGLDVGFMSVILPPSKDPTGAAMGVAAALQRGEDMLNALKDFGWTRKEYAQEASPRFQAAVLATLEKWWAEHVECNVAPTATALECDKKALGVLNADGAPSIDFGEAEAAQVAELETVNAEIKAREKIKARIENVLTQKAGAASWQEAKALINRARKEVGA